MTRAAIRTTFALASGAVIAACAAGNGGNAGVTPPVSSKAPGSRAAGGAARSSWMTSKIEHVVIVIQENRSFDNLFGTFPGADGATQGESVQHGVVPLAEEPLVGPKLGSLA